MTGVMKNMFELSRLMDNSKSKFGNISKRKAMDYINKDGADMFVLYYAFFSLFENINDIDLELDTVNILVKNKKNADRIKAIYSASIYGSYWTSVTTFITSIQAVIDEDIIVDATVPYSQEDIIWSISVLMGIDGSEFLPAKTEVVKYIAACVTHYGQEEPPFGLSFNSILQELGKKESASVFKDMTINDLYRIDDVSRFGKISPSDLNHLLEETEVATSLNNRYNKMLSDWNNIFE